MRNIISNWPDAIRCRDSVFMLHAGSVTTGAMYDQVYAGEVRYVIFNSDGSFKSRGGYDGSSIGCKDKSISQLYANGNAFNLVSSKIQDNSGLTSIITNWPDAVRCGDAVFMLHAGSITAGAMYDQVYAGEVRYVVFNSDGSFKSRVGYDGSSIGCKDKSISQLYAGGNAFNFADRGAVPTFYPTPSPTIPPTDFRGISTLREGQAPNECFESDISFDVAGKSESFTYITTEQSSGYSYVISNKYTGSAYFGALKFANMALEASVSHYNFKAVSVSSYSATIGVVHSLPISVINPKLNNLGEEIYETNSADDFKFKCGDKISSNYESYITVTLAFNYIFKSREEKNKFKDDVGVSNTINNWLTKGSFKSTDVEYFEKYSGYLSLSIEQFGGSPTLLLKDIGSNLGFCGLSNIKVCAEIIANVNRYINSHNFQDQLDHSKWNTRLIANIEALPISTIHGIDTSNYQSDYISNDLSKARSDLINKLNQVTSDYNYVQGLHALITGDNCETTAIYSNAFDYEVKNAITIIRNYLEVLTDSNSGVPSCYSDYKNCVNAIAPRLLSLAYDYSDIAISKSICTPVECPLPGTAEIGVDDFELYDDWYLNNFFTNSDECYYGCFVTNEYCFMEKEIGATSGGNALNSNMEFLAGATIAALAGIALI